MKKFVCIFCLAMMTLPSTLFAQSNNATIAVMQARLAYQRADFLWQIAGLELPHSEASDSLRMRELQFRKAFFDIRLAAMNIEFEVSKHSPDGKTMNFLVADLIDAVDELKLLMKQYDVSEPAYASLVVESTDLVNDCIPLMENP